MADGNTSKRGFARMDAQKQREIASKGGRAAHEKGTAHKFTSEEAREAGRKGGERSRGRRSQSTPNTAPVEQTDTHGPAAAGQHSATERHEDQDAHDREVHKVDQQ